MLYMFLNRSCVCSEISSLCESHDSGFYKQKGKRFSLMTINAGSWSEGFYEGGLKKELYIVEKNWY